MHPVVGLHRIMDELNAVLIPRDQPDDRSEQQHRTRNHGTASLMEHQACRERSRCQDADDDEERARSVSCAR